MLIQLSELCTVQLDMESTQVGRHDLRQALKSPHANHVLQKAKDFGCQGSFVAFFFFPALESSQLSIISLESLRKSSNGGLLRGQGNLQLGKSCRPSLNYQPRSWTLSLQSYEALDPGRLLLLLLVGVLVASRSSW